MLLVSITERDNAHKNYSTVESLTQLYRGLCSNLDLKKFISMSNFNLFTCNFNFDYDELVSSNDFATHFYEPSVSNLADSIYEYMQDNLDVYYDIVREIDTYRQEVKNYNIDE